MKKYIFHNELYVQKVKQLKKIKAIESEINLTIGMMVCIDNKSYSITDMEVDFDDNEISVILDEL